MSAIGASSSSASAQRPATPVSGRKDGGWVTRYVAVSFQEGANNICPGPAIECLNGGTAIKRAHLMTHEAEISGAVAFSRRTHAASGEPEDAIILSVFGTVPDGFDIA
jgi:hypothetical protein